MSNNPFNLALRFLLELVILYALGRWGWTQHTGVLRWLLAIGLPLLAAALWGTFRAYEPEQPGKKPVLVPGYVRLGLEFVLFGVAIWAFDASGMDRFGMVYGLVVLLHYLASYDRVGRLLSQQREKYP